MDYGSCQETRDQDYRQTGPLAEGRPCQNDKGWKEVMCLTKRTSLGQRPTSRLRKDTFRPRGEKLEK
jgi:hypothetical protein